MTTVSNPVVNITKAPADQIIDNGPQAVLVVGQQTGSTYTSGQLVESIGNANIEINNFGKGSHLSEMLRAFKRINEVTRIDAIPLDDAGGATAASGTIDFTGSVATEAGTITVNIGSRKNHSYEIAISSGDNATAIGDALVSAIGDDEFAIVTAVNTTGSVALTAKNAGTIGNKIGLEGSGLVGGVTFTVTGFASGATDPSLTGLFDVIGDSRYQTVIFPGEYDESVLTDFLDPRWNAENSIEDGVGVIGKTDTISNIETFVGALNSQNLVVQCNSIVNDTLYKGSALFELDDVISAQFGAIRSLRLTDGSNISRYVTANNLDVIGGTNKATLPYFDSPFFDLPIIDIGKGWSKTEVKQINDAGGFVIGNNVTRTNVICDQVYTTYKTDVAGNTDLTYQYLNSVDNFSGVAEFCFNNLRADFSQFRLTDGAVIPNYNIANANTIKSKLIEYYDILSGPDYLLTRAGRENVKFFSQSIDITLDLLEGKVTSIAEVPLVTQLRRLDVILKAVFNT